MIVVWCGCSVIVVWLQCDCGVLLQMCGCMGGYAAGVVSVSDTAVFEVTVDRSSDGV